MDKIHIKNAPSLSIQCLTHALDRLSCLDHYFSQSREYLIKHVRNKDELHMPNSSPIFLSMGLCGQVRDRLILSSIEISNAEEFLEYLKWRFFNEETYPIKGTVSDYPNDVQENMQNMLDGFNDHHRNHYSSQHEQLLYYWHQSRAEHFYPLMQYDSESPYGAQRLKLLKEMVRTLTEIRTYAVKIQTEGEYQHPVIGSVIAPNELIK